MTKRLLPEGEALKALIDLFSQSSRTQQRQIAKDLGFSNRDSLLRCLRTHGIYHPERTQPKGKINIKVVHAQVTGDGCVYLMPLADFHDGHQNFDEEALRGYIDWVQKTPNAYVVLNGDLIDAPTISSRASAFYQQVRTPQEAIEHVADLLRPIQERILAATDGTHEKRITKETGLEPVLEILLRLNLRAKPQEIYAPDSILLEIDMGGDFQYLCYIIHGWGGARKTGGQVNKAEELGVVIHADLYLIAHEHTLFLSRNNYAILQGGRLRAHRKVFVGCGGFQGYGDYLQNIGRRLPDIGAPRIRLEGPLGGKGHKDIHVDI